MPVRISAVIATKGRPARLRATLDSMSRCEPPPAEVIVVDGDPAGSARAVAESLTAVDGPIRLPVRWVPSEPGLTTQRNQGLELVGGEVVAFVDDDVDFDHGVFRVLGRVYRDSSVVGATGWVVEDQGRRFGNTRSAVRRFLPGGGEEGRMTRFGYPRRIQAPNRERDVEFMLGSLMTARTEAARRVRFDERLSGYGLAEDEDFSYRLSRLGRIRYVPDAVIRHEGTGARASASREFNRSVVVNRAYLFRKNFPQTPLTRTQFAMLVAILLVHRALNREWAGVRGLVEGSVETWRSRR